MSCFQEIRRKNVLRARTRHELDFVCPRNAKSVPYSMPFNRGDRRLFEGLVRCGGWDNFVTVFFLRFFDANNKWRKPSEHFFFPRCHVRSRKNEEIPVPDVTAVDERSGLQWEA